MSVRECEDSSLKGWTNGFREFLARSLPAKESRVEHMTGRWRVMPAWRFLRVSHGKGLPAKYLRNILFGKMSCFVLPSLYPHYIYPHYPQIVRSAFQRENPSPNTYHTQSKCKVRFWSCWQVLEGAIHWQMQSDWIARSGKLEKTRFREASW